MATLDIKDFPDDLYADLRERAKRDHRSIAQQVIHILSTATKGATPKHSVLELDGLGPDARANVDPIVYLDGEREDWDDSRT